MGASSPGHRLLDQVCPRITAARKSVATASPLSTNRSRNEVAALDGVVVVELAVVGEEAEVESAVAATLVIATERQM